MKEYKTTSVLRVSLSRPVCGKYEFYFGSVKAIFLVLTPADVGATLSQLWAAHASRNPKTITDRAVIERLDVIHAPQTKIKKT